MRFDLKYTSIYGVFLFLMFFANNSIHAQGHLEGIRTVVLDAGHGGNDPGALGSKSKEKDIVLSIALKVGTLINKEFPDVNVVYTRKTDVFVELNKRAEIANQSKADVFISIHANSVSNPKTRSTVKGALTLVLGAHRTNENMQVAQLENSVICLEDDYQTKYEGFDPSSAESYIIFSLMQNIYLNQSLQLAEIMQQYYKSSTAMVDRGVQQAGLLVLARTTMPAILTEIGFICNPTEEKYMMSENGQNKLASAIFSAFKQYKNTIDTKNANLSTPSTTNGSTNIIAQVEKTPKSSNVAQNTTKKTSSSNPAVKTSANTNNNDGTWYYVQILASKTPINQSSREFKGEKNIVTITTKGYYRYGVIKTRSFDEASNKLKNIKSKFPQAFVTATSNGEIITVPKNK